jgi:hypothetical protein
VQITVGNLRKFPKNLVFRPYQDSRRKSLGRKIFDCFS